MRPITKWERDELAIHFDRCLVCRKKAAAYQYFVGQFAPAIQAWCCGKECFESWREATELIISVGGGFYR